MNPDGTALDQMNQGLNLLQVRNSVLEEFGLSHSLPTIYLSFNRSCGQSMENNRCFYIVQWLLLQVREAGEIWMSEVTLCPLTL